MLYLTKIEVNHESAAIRRFHDTYAWHQAVWKIFPERQEESRNFLFRMDVVSEGYRLFVLSPIKPVQPDWCSSDNYAFKEIKPSFFEHQYYKFDLKSNPTKKIKIEKEGKKIKNGKRIVLTGREMQYQWMIRKAESSGFAVLEQPALQIEPMMHYHFRKKAQDAQTGLHVGIRFLGVLEVKDKEKFKHTFINGIGSAKGFGFGMLLLQPLK